MTEHESLDDRVEWGELLSPSLGELDTFVARARLDGRPCVIKRFRTPELRREIDVYVLLQKLGVPTLEMLDHGEDWLAIEDIDASPIWRRAKAEDLDDPVVVRHLADWYARLHLAGAAAAELPDFDESAMVTDETLVGVARRWPDLADGILIARQWLPGWKAAVETLPHTLTYNDFSWDNAVVAHDHSAAMMIDYDLLGRGYRYADVRNVLSQLGATQQDFWADYAALAGGIAADEVEIDQRLAPLVALVAASERRFTELPAWARDAADYVRSLASS